MRQIIIAALLAPLLMLFGQEAPGAKNAAAFAQDYDSAIRLVLEKFPEVPGVAVVVIQQDRPVFVRGYGLSDKEKGVKADANTLYYIASATKSFTALAAALLDREGKIRLGDPITKHTAPLIFTTPVPDSVTVQDLLTHTSGLRNSPLVFRMAYSGEARDEDMMRVLLEATKYDEARHGKYAYDNLGYNIYGLLLQRRLKQKWQDTLQAKLFGPLKMRRTTSYISKAQAAGLTMAQPYLFSPETGTVVRAPLAKADSNMQSAGGIVTSASDLGRWLRLNMNGGKLDGKQVIPAEVLTRVQTGYTRTTRDSGPFQGEGEYGLGWQIGRYAGERVIYHLGGFPGWSSHVSFMPDKRTGVAVLINESTTGGPVGSLLAKYVYDYWLGTANREANYAAQIENGAAAYRKALAGAQAAARDRAKRKWQLSKPLPDYAGRYRNDHLGELVISIDRGIPRVRLGNIDVLSTPFTKTDSIRVELIPGQGEVIQFEEGAGGQISGLTLAGARFARVG